jgi:hypothetical protein
MNRFHRDDLSFRTQLDDFPASPFTSHAAICGSTSSGLA